MPGNGGIGGHRSAKVQFTVGNQTRELVDTAADIGRTKITLTFPKVIDIKDKIVGKNKIKVTLEDGDTGEFDWAP